MADVVTIGVLVAVLVIILMGLIFAKSQGKGDKDSKNRNRRAAVPTRDEDGQIVGAPAASVGPRGRRGGPRMRRTVQVQEELEDNQVEAAEDDGEGDNEVLENKPGKIGRKKLEKLQAKADKKKEREFLEREREERKKQREKEDEEAQKLAEKEKAEEERLEEEARKRKEEKERKEHEEYLKLKASFDVQEEGFDEEEDDDSEDKLQSFIQYIKVSQLALRFLYKNLTFSGDQGCYVRRFGCTFQVESTRLHRQSDAAVRRRQAHRSPGRQGQIHLHFTRRIGIDSQVYQATRTDIHIRSRGKLESIDHFEKLKM